jgi:hypothetical protein
VITTQQVRIILDRNRNGLDGLPRSTSGEQIGRGLYWDEATRRVVPVEGPQAADRALVLLSDDLEITFDELVRRMAMGGGGHTGRAVPYHAAAGSVSHHH